MLYGVPFEAAHLQHLVLQPAQQWCRSYLQGAELRTLENEWAATLMHDGRPIACVGPALYWENRALVWSFISTAVCQSNFLTIHRLAKAYLAGLPFRRLEAAVDVDFDAGHRWARALGFQLEAACMSAFQLDGRDCALYARVRRAWD